MRSKKEITPPKTNMTMEKQLFEDVKMHFLLKNAIFQLVVWVLRAVWKNWRFELSFCITGYVASRKLTASFPLENRLLGFQKTKPPTCLPPFFVGEVLVSGESIYHFCTVFFLESKDFSSEISGVGAALSRFYGKRRRKTWAISANTRCLWQIVLKDEVMMRICIICTLFSRRYNSGRQIYQYTVYSIISLCKDTCYSYGFCRLKRIFFRIQM